MFSRACCGVVRVAILQSSYSTLLLTHLFLSAVKLGLNFHILACATGPNHELPDLVFAFLQSAHGTAQCRVERVPLKSSEIEQS